MAAITTRLLYLRPILRPHSYPLHHFSSSSSSHPQSPEPEPGESTSQTQDRPKSPFSSYFNDVKDSLRREPSPPNRSQRPMSFSKPTPPPITPPTPSKPIDLQEISRTLSVFRNRSASSPPSLQELYKKNVNSKPSVASPLDKPSLDAIKEKFLHMRAAEKNQTGPGGKTLPPGILARFRDNLKLKPDQNAPNDNSNFFKSTSGKGTKDSDGGGSMKPLFKEYTYPELGKKLETLRPETKKANWFSLQELKDRLTKLKEIQKEEDKGRTFGILPYAVFKQSFEKIQEDEKKLEANKHKMQWLSLLGETQKGPPKEHLVEQYFHPDNMSSAEKLKLQLKKVRDEFKMSESDCGSARVQVAQLTTKIKHLSTVLAKKDKHSRKGLQAMVQQRKKLLKYLRRTDWDSYCMVLSKLGLRDNPDIKA